MTWFDPIICDVIKNGIEVKINLCVQENQVSCCTAEDLLKNWSFFIKPI